MRFAKLPPRATSITSMQHGKICDGKADSSCNDETRSQSVQAVHRQLQTGTTAQLLNAAT
eukprot:6205625-Pleurochrysis_carterae.AAC.2